MFLNLFLNCLIGYFCILILAWLLAAISGHDRRAYPALTAADQVEIAGQAMQVSDLAAKYQPKMYLRKSTISPPLLWVWYEAVASGEQIDLTYYHVWENENNPNRTIDRTYKIFRAAYYGYPLYDVEYVQVSVELQSGLIKQVRFETGPVDDYYVPISEHLVARYTAKAGGKYDLTLSAKSGKLIASQEDVAVMSDGTRVMIMAQTWNHLSRLVRSDDQDFDLLDAPLKLLSAREYAQYKFVRKSQGDHQTKPGLLSKTLGMPAMFLFVYLPAFLIIQIQSLKQRGTKGNEPGSN